MTQQGWQCPRCGAGCSPSLVRCPCIAAPITRDSDGAGSPPETTSGQISAVDTTLPAWRWGYVPRPLPPVEVFPSW